MPAEEKENEQLHEKDIGRILPRYPVYVPSKGRYESGLTIKFLIRDKVPFYLVVEPQEADEYGKRYGYEHLLILPWRGDDAVRRKYCADLGIENGGLIAVRNWIKQHSIANGFKRHWQLDDNIRQILRRWKQKRIICNAGAALAIAEDFADRYENIALIGLNYKMFLTPVNRNPPFYLNHWVYSNTLVLNEIPYKWRIAYNDDTDLCLQVLANGWCTVKINAFMIEKTATMVIKGGNTTDLYQGDGRLKMAKALERMWPGVVKTTRRYGRPQHWVDWNKFDNRLKLRTDIKLPPNRIENYGLELVEVKPIKSASLREFLKDDISRRYTGEPKKE